MCMRLRAGWSMIYFACADQARRANCSVGEGEGGGEGYTRQLDEGEKGGEHRKKFRMFHAIHTCIVILVREG